MEKNRMYQFYELRDEMRKAISNSETVERSEKELVAVIIGSQKAEGFKDFTKSLSENWPRYENERLTLKSRLKKVEDIIARYEKRDEESALVSEIASLVLEALGAVKAASEKDA